MFFVVSLWQSNNTQDRHTTDIGDKQVGAIYGVREQGVMTFDTYTKFLYVLFFSYSDDRGHCLTE